MTALKIQKLAKQVQAGFFEDMGFDGFGDDDFVAPPPSTLHIIEKKHGLGLSQLFSGRTYLKPPGLRVLEEERISYWPNKAWAIHVDANSKSQAKKLGERVQRNLVPQSKLHSSNQLLHYLPLYVIFGEEYIKMDGLERKTPNASPARDQKRKIMLKGKEVFGAKGVSLSGRVGLYKLRIMPALKKWRGRFSPFEIRATDLFKLEEELDKVLKRLEEQI